MIISKTQINTKKCPKVRLTQGYIKTRLEGLESNWRTFRENHLNILKATQKVERSTIDYFSEELYEQCEDIYVNLVADLEDELLKLTKPAPEHSENSHQLEQECNTSNHASHFKLPAINIPTFSGDYNDWNSFHDLFVSLIHQNHSLSDVQKLHYLKTSITGEAEQLLKNVQITNANYDKAWCTLKKRFDNKRLIVHNILHRLVAQKKLQIESAKSLKSLLDITMECLNSLKNLDVSTDSWDPLIVFLITQKFDNDSLRQWEEELSQLESSELPTMAMLEKFLSKRFKVLEMIQNNTAKPVTIKEPMKSKAFHISSEIKCPFCSFGHRLFTCKEFSKLDVSKRYEFVKDKLLCFNCLAPGHSVMLCKQSTSCRRCGKKHHSLLHLSSPLGPSSKTETSSNPTESKNIEPTITSHLATRGQMTLMATALVHVKLGKQVHLLRALVDPCSQESFITESAAQRLQLRRSPIRGHVSGVGQMTTPIKHVAELEIESRLNAAIKLSLSAYVVKKITSITPLKRVNIENLTHLQGLSFADPTFHSPGQIDLLLGANVYTEVLIDGVIKGPPGSPIAQNTHLGWILTGNAEVGDEGKTSSSNIITLHLNVELDNMLRKFWEIEDIASERHSQNSEQSKAEKIYEETVTRGADGRYTVRLPFKTEPAILPTGSREIASRRLSSLEKRLSKDPQLYKEYDNVLQEYLTLNHMELIVHDTPEQRARAVYLPHHAIVKLDRQTTKDTVTKRTVLREIASLFDPLGWLSPAIITAKIFMQKLWLHGKDWDEIVPSQLKDEWLKYRSELPALSKLSIQRWIHTSQDQKVLELHGFSDASMAAYAAVVYARVVLPNEEVKVSLITSKTKVTPLKQVSLPRLELCAASLLCKLLNQVAAAMRVKKQHIFAWSDSMIVSQAWINGDPSRWKPFIKNRVVEITESYESHHWFYVNTKENPADFASRGVAPSQLLGTEMWWKGPAFLSYSEISAIKPEVPETEEEKRKSVKCCHVISEEEEDFKLTLLKRYSSLSKLVRVVSYCRRWLLSLKKNKDKRKVLPEYVTYEERNESLTCCIKMSQSIEFREELESLKKKGSVKRTSHLLSLAPFLDDQGVLRVGGRLKHAESRLVEKHPIIIGTQNLLLPLILREAHSATLHGGPQMMSYYLRSRYWLIRSTNTIKRFYMFFCTSCHRLVMIVIINKNTMLINVL
ncbi:hypothetical protein ABMA27_004314 [Loxostege sticticalis]|uniref:Peptidase aspartic putative domain-containing protein n=1 Tax=Loxostege sticticalis TaxID=481309 RepID=A0ABR3HN62_LOXSC